MSRSLKNRNIGNIASHDDLKRALNWDYEWVDGGDGFLYLVDAYDHSPRSQWQSRHRYQRERLAHWLTGGTDKKVRKLENKKRRARVRAKIHNFLVGRIDDIVHNDTPHRQYWTW